jgi:hypothetical protein
VLRHINPGICINCSLAVGKEVAASTGDLKGGLAIATAEALLLGQRAGTDPQVLQQTLGGSSAARYDTKLWMRDLMEGAAYLPK